MEGLGRKASSVGNVLGAGVGVDVARRVEGAVSKVRSDAEARLAKARGDVPAATRAQVVGMFGGIPLSAVAMVGGLVLVAFFILRKR
jgi:hypothetical protein